MNADTGREKTTLGQAGPRREGNEDEACCYCGPEGTPREPKALKLDNEESAMQDGTRSSSGGGAFPPLQTTPPRSRTANDE